jgi:hypothetical protein
MLIPSQSPIVDYINGYGTVHRVYCVYIGMYVKSRKLFRRKGVYDPLKHIT